MQGDNSDREQIDRLVRELMTPRHGAGPTQPVSQRPTRPAPARPASVPSGASRPAEHQYGNRWTNVRLLMPPARAPELARRLTFASAVSLPQLPGLRQLVRMPGPATVARMWVALAAFYSASMAFWPYPRTYLWGIVSYLLCLGLVLVSGVWGARLSWDARLGTAHSIAIGSVLWAVTLAAAEALRNL